VDGENLDVLSYELHCNLHAVFLNEVVGHVARQLGWYRGVSSSLFLGLMRLFSFPFKTIYLCSCNAVANIIIKFRDWMVGANPDEVFRELHCNQQAVLKIKWLGFRSATRVVPRSLFVPFLGD
jgi:hypothetical protein